MDDSMSLGDYAKSIRSSSSPSLWNYDRTLLSLLEISDEQADGSSHLGMSRLHYYKSLGSSSFPLARNDVGILPPVLESSDEKADGCSHLGPSSRFFFFNRRFNATSDKENRKNSMESHREYAQENFFLECRKSIRLLGALAASETYQAGLNPPGGFQSGTESERIRYLNRKNSMETHREYAHGNYVQLPEALAAPVTNQAGLNPPGGFWSDTESERIRCQGSNKQFKEETTSWTLFSCKLAIALFYSLPVALFEAPGIPLQAKAAAGTSMVAIALLYTLLNLFDSIKYYFCAYDHMVDNAVAEAAANWHLLSGSPHHATWNRECLHNYETVDGLIIQLGDGMRMPVSGRGTVVMDTMVLPDVWFVPELKKNIVSVSQLAELDCNIVFKRDACYISSATDGSIIGKALLKENSMFKLEFLKVPPVI